jgi:ABC-type nitrate/sulfonate/bicarbonate transport system ATPase subunit
VDDTLAFVADFGDGRQHPALRLSGGQKVVLALAFRVAVLGQLAAGVGLLCLDEPTAGLSRQSLTCVEVALDRLRALSSSTGLQVILVTHEPRAGPLVRPSGEGTGRRVSVVGAHTIRINDLHWVHPPTDAGLRRSAAVRSGGRHFQSRVRAEDQMKPHVDEHTPLPIGSGDAVRQVAAISNHEPSDDYLPYR